MPDDGGTGGATASAASTGAGSNGVTAAASSTGSFATSTSAGAGGGGGASVECPVILDDGYYFEVDGPVLGQYFSGCGRDPFPVARYSPGGECASGFHMSACEPNAGDASLFAPEPGPATGNYSVGDDVYVLALVDVDFLNVGEVGGSVRGTFEGTANGTDGTSTPITGSFHLCRVPDLPPCP